MPAIPLTGVAVAARPVCEHLWIRAAMAEEGVPPEAAHHAAAMAGIKKAQEESQRQRQSRCVQ